MVTPASCLSTALAGQWQWQWLLEFPHFCATLPPSVYSTPPAVPTLDDGAILTAEPRLLKQIDFSQFKSHFSLSQFLSWYQLLDYSKSWTMFQSSSCLNSLIQCREKGSRKVQIHFQHPWIPYYSPNTPLYQPCFCQNSSALLKSKFTSLSKVELVSL